MAELYIVYTLIISLVLIFSAGLYYFYTKFNQLEGELGFVKNSFNELEQEDEQHQNESSSNFGSELDHFVSDSECDDEQTQLKLAEDFYRSLTNNQDTGIVSFDDSTSNAELNENENTKVEEVEEENSKPKRKYTKKKQQEE